MAFRKKFIIAGKASFNLIYALDSAHVKFDV